MKPLNTEQHQWVEKTLAVLSPEERVAQLLIPQCPSDARAEALAALAGEVPFGGAFMVAASAATIRQRIARLQAAAAVPLVMASDLECGAGHIIHEAVAFPEPLAVAAADSEELAHTMGAAAGSQGRAGRNFTWR